MKNKQIVEILGSRHTSCKVCERKPCVPSWVPILPFKWRD